MASDLSATKIAHLNKMNKASKDAGLGTKLAAAETDIDNAQTDITNLTSGTTGVVRKITQTVLKSAFTDGGSTSGTYTLTAGTIPAKATVLFSAVTAVTAFSGDTSAVIAIGDGTTANRYMTGTPSVFTTAANGVSVGAVSGTAYHDTGKSIVLTVTSATDFTNVAGTGSVTVAIYYVL